MVSGGVGTGPAKPPRITPQGGDYPSNYLSSTTHFSWKGVVVLCALMGAMFVLLKLFIG